MSGTPKFKVYDAAGVYQAAAKDTTLAAVVVAVLGDGSTIRAGHRRVLWTEGVDGSAALSYDEAADVAADRFYAEEGER